MSVPTSNPWLLVIGGAQRGGAEGQLVRLASHLHNAGKPIECVFLFGGGPLTEHLDREGVPWRVLRGTQTGYRVVRIMSLAFAVLRLAILLHRRQPAVVMAWLTFAIWPTLLLAELLTSARRVAGVRGEVLRTEVRWAAPLFRRAMRRATAVVVNSPSLIDEAVRWGAEPDRVSFIPNGVDRPDKRSDPAQSTSAVVVANYRPYKGHADLLQALTFCRSNVHVRLCGAGPARTTVEQLAKDLGVLDRVVFVPQPTNVPEELARAGFAIHPSHTEGLSNAILEQMAAGLPVVAMNVGGNPVLIEHGVSGYLLDVGDHHALASAIDELVSDCGLRRRLGDVARAKSERFSWISSAEQYGQLLEGGALRGS